MVSPGALINYARAQIGKPYIADAHRFGPQHYDCSGLVHAALVANGIHDPAPYTSWSQARWCYANGGHISVADAERTYGALLFEGPNAGMDGYGPDGHVCFSTGDGRVIEARGHAYGVVWDSAAGRPWSGAAKIPGVAYGGAPVPVQPPNIDWKKLGQWLRALAINDLKADHSTLGWHSGLHSGDEVKHWQNALNLACNWSLAVDGAFGPSTDAATRQFQRFWRLGVDGLVGPQSRGACEYVLAVHP